MHVALCWGVQPSHPIMRASELVSTVAADPSALRGSNAENDDGRLALSLCRCSMRHAISNVLFTSIISFL